MYKMIALDMDGTLLSSDKTLSERNRRAIEQAQLKGVKVVLASGRPLQGMKAFADSLNMTSKQDFIVCYNGSLVYRASDNKVVRQHIMTGKEAKAIAKLARQLNVHHHAFSVEKGLITPKLNPYTDHEATVNGLTINEFDFSLLDDNEAVIKTMFADSKDVIDNVINQIPNSFSEEFTLVRSASIFYEFLHKQSNKGLAIKSIADSLSIPSEQVICMGDAENDHHMIKYAGLGVAMGNATEETKNIANYITETNDNSGVADVIEKFVLN